MYQSFGQNVTDAGRKIGCNFRALQLHLQTPTCVEKRFSHSMMYHDQTKFQDKYRNASRTFQQAPIMTVVNSPELGLRNEVSNLDGGSHSCFSVLFTFHFEGNA